MPAAEIGVARWDVPKQSGEPPCPRSGHSFAVVGRRAFLFGGCGEVNGTAAAFNDMHQLEMSNCEWKKIEISGSVVPAPRWNHTMTTTSGTSMILFGGCSKKERFADVFSFDANGDGSFTQVVVEGTAPFPRSSHAAVFTENQIFYFGGYGGEGKSRVFMNDMFSLLLADGNATWVHHAHKGTAPKPRCSHSMTPIANGKMLIVVGGRDHLGYFDDSNVFDVSTLSWTQLNSNPNPPMPLALCAHTAVSLEAVPSFKVFVFGGQTGSAAERKEWTYTNGISVFDTNSQTWDATTVKGDQFPCAREDHRWAYDRKSSKLFVFGGWSGRWLNDLYSLDVAPIVGPPFCVTGTEPKEGPITGGIPIRIFGIQFPEAKDVMVKFTNGEKEENVPGQWVSSSEVTCRSPSWEKFGAGDVEVRVNMKGEGFTVNRVKFTFYVNTMPAKCLAYGPGINDEGAWGYPAKIIVQSKDRAGKNRTSGSDVYHLQVKRIEDDVSVEGWVKDNKNGTYELTYIPRREGSYLVSVLLEDTNDQNIKKEIKGSPWTVTFEDPWSRPPKISGDAPKCDSSVVSFTVGRSLGLNCPAQNNCVHFLNTDTWKWLSPACENPPPLIESHSLVAFDADKALLMGGRRVPADAKPGSKEKGPISNEMWVAHLDKETFKWIKVNEVTGKAPSPVIGPGCVVIPAQKKILVYGGSNNANELSSTLHLLSTGALTKMEWTEVSHKGPCIPVAHAGAAFGEGTFYALGGICPWEALGVAKKIVTKTIENDDGTTKEIQEEEEVPETVMFPGLMTGTVDTKTNSVVWSRPQTSGQVPTPRKNATSAFIDGKIHFYGGYDEKNKFLDELYVLDPETMEWSILYASDYHYIGDNNLNALVQKKIVSVSSTRSSWDEVRVLDFGKQESVTAKINGRFAKQMRDLDKMLGESMRQLTLRPQDEISAEGQFKVLVQAMNAIHDIKQKMPIYDLQFEVLRESITYLASTGTNVDRQEKELKDAMDRWTSVKKQAPESRENVRPILEKEIQKLKVNVTNFHEKMKEERKKFEAKNIFKYETGTEAAYKSILSTRTELLAFEKDSKLLAENARIFDQGDIMKPSQEILAKNFEDLSKVTQLWHTIAMINTQFDSWRSTLWKDINTDEMEEVTKNFIKFVKSMDKSIRTHDAYINLDAESKKFMSSIPLIADLKHPSMRDRHWDAVKKVTKSSFTVDASFKLSSLIDIGLFNFEEDISEIVNGAQKEQRMEVALKKISSVWTGVEFEFTKHKDTDLHLIRLKEEDFDTLEDHQVQIQNMMSSKYVAVFEKEVVEWQGKLSKVSDVNGIMSEIQRTWAYLETLFIGSEEVKKELPEDTVRFAQVNVTMEKSLRSLFAAKKAVDGANAPGLYDDMEQMQDKLTKCEKSLANYLENKRQIFPRFFFVSTADLLDILSNGNTPSKVMVHMSKIIAAVGTMTLKEGNTPNDRPCAIDIDSCVGQERFVLAKPLPLVGRVEIYLQDVIVAIAEALRQILVSSNKEYAVMKRTDWARKVPNQVMLSTSLVYFTLQMEEVFANIAKGNANAMKEYRGKKQGELVELIDLVRSDLTKGERQKIMCLITLDAHSRDIIDKILEENVTDVKAFQWQSQLRFSWSDKEQDCMINICDAEFHYYFEYQGNGPRLVITPLTDRIYVTCTQALHLMMGCAPAGPAGTGKTETVKDLAAMTAKACYVFNCSPEMDYRSLGDIFKGLASSGAFGCFDEFNRLIAEVLSVAGAQYRCIIDAIRAYRDTFTLMGATLKLNRDCGAFLTMNPGYLGRQELPESLKVLFRPVTVVVPDMGLICENMLMAEGFTEAKPLAIKFVTLYALLRDLLSKAMHYDWGLRAIKSVLVVAGGFKRGEPTVDEFALLFRALRDFNLPKIVGDDLVVFTGLLDDLFPGISIPRKRDMTLEKAIEEAAIEMGLQPEPEFQLKVVQLIELMAIRHSVFILGTSGTGKSEIWKTLTKANTNIGNRTSTRVINPKSISTNEFYGYIQLATREWKDGIFSITMRELANATDSNPKWIILDGDLDANWIESMNSVMDDNKLLTLASNERIQLKPNMKIIFELRDLRYASPATVSRAGIVYVTETKQWESFVQSWIAKRDDDTAERKAYLLSLFKLWVPETIKAIRKEFEHLIPILDFGMVQNLCYILDALLTLENIPKGTPDDKKIVETYFGFAAIWAFGGAFSIKDGVDQRKKFNTWYKAKWTQIKFPGKQSIYDFFVDKATFKFVPWTQIVQEVSYDSSTPMLSVFVPTGETVAVRSLLDNLVDLKRPVCLIGPAGSGKTAIVKGKLKDLNEDFMSMVVNFNYYTDSKLLQATLESVLVKKTGKNYGPPGNKKLIYFIDDLNMPQLDPYDTQSAIALLRQHIDYGCWYDRAKMTIKNIGNSQYLACMNPTAGSFLINPRLQRHFVTFAIGFPANESLMTIFSTFLNGHLKNFAEGIKDPVFTNKVVQAALELQTKVASTFRKTAINFHYEFSVRHLSSVFQGLMLATPSHFTEPSKFAGLWTHESERTYSDRLVSEADLQAFQKAVKDIGKKYFKDLNQNEVFPDFNVFCNCWKDLEDKSYNRVPKLEELRRILEDALASYNDQNAAMDLVLFEDAMRHVCRISRIVSTGNALLVGVGGSGKQSLSRLAAFICQQSTFQIAISGNYGVNEFREDLKGLYTRAGVKGEPVLFLFTDSQIADEKFLVFLNELLASGNIPDLFPADEVEGICNSVRSEAKSAGVKDTPETLYDFFIQKIRANLHLCLAFSPVGESFRRRASRFPSLINCSVIDWFQPWPQEALLSVSKRFLDEVDLGDAKTKEAVCKFMPFSFTIVNKTSTEYLAVERRYNYTTPKSFLELIYLYKSMLAKKRVLSAQAIDRLENGLNKLQKTAKDVDALQEMLKVKSVEVDEKKQAANELMEKVGAEKAKVGAEADKAQIEAEKCAVIAERCGIQERDCLADLAKAEPAVKAAEEALDTLNKKDLGELKSLAKPPAGIDDVTGAILAMRGEKDRSWNAAKAMMKDVNAFIQELKGMKQIIDTGNMKAKDVDGARPYLALEHFTAEVMKKKSNAAAGLCVFVLNIVMYYDIVTTVEPKRNALRLAQEELETAQTKLAEINAFVGDLQAKLAKLESEFNAVVEEKNRVVAEADKLQAKLDLATRLMNALGSENDRWTISVDNLKKQESQLVGDVLMASAFCSYVGCFNKKYRQLLIFQNFIPFLKQEKVPISDNPDPVAILTDPAKIAGWNNEGLPTDPVSVENAAIITTAERWSLLIDPQLQGIGWLKEKESKNNLQLVRLGQKNTLNVLERALENGFTVLIENIQESIDAVLGPVIGRNKIKKSRNFFVKLGDKEVEWSPSFKLYIQTKLANPHYPPEIQAECTLVNFTVTEVGLEDQLLAKVVQKERPDLEEQKSFLIRQQNEFRIKLKELEDGLLKQLSDAKGDILEDVALIESLEAAKALSTEIGEKVIIAQETEIKINDAREFYRVIATRASLLFFILSDMFKIHQFYHYSLSSFTTVFLRSIAQAGKTVFKTKLLTPKVMAAMQKNPFKKVKWVATFLKAGMNRVTENGKIATSKEVDLDKRIPQLINSVTMQVYDYTRAGLLGKHKLLFASLVSFRILERDGTLNPAELNYLISGKKRLDGPLLSADVGSWLTEANWSQSVALQDLGKPFDKFLQDLEQNHKLWKPWVNEAAPENCKFPGAYDELSKFQKLLILRALRPDRVVNALTQFIRDAMGPKYIDQEPFEIFKTYRECSPGTALFFYLFPGADVIKDLTPILDRKGYSVENGKFISIGMGQGQEPGAEAALDQCMKDGGWVFLQNINLMTMWVKVLERKLEASQNDSVHPDFRCFLSAEPPGDPQMKTIPESILQNSIKIANEPSQDMKANLVRAWNVFDQDFLDKVEPNKRKNFRSVLLGLCVFHSLVLGRRRFGYQGWSRAYSFNMGDLTQCADVLVNQIQNKAPNATPWQDLRYIFGEIMYGGHITDKYDRRTNNTYLEVGINEGLLSGKDMVPGFKAITDGDYLSYEEYIKTQLPGETPALYGLHPNAEIGFLTTECNTLFSTVMELSSGSGGGGGGKDKVVQESMLKLLGQCPASFNVFEINLRIQEKHPFVVVLMQEIDRMNTLLDSIRKTLSDLKLGLEGALNISDAMDNLANALFLNKVPAIWEKDAYPSSRTLADWYPNLLERVEQLVKWSETLVTPASVWLCGLFNPMAFVTAVMQVTARKKQWALDNVTLETHITAYEWNGLKPEGIDKQPEESAYVHGMYLQGARWDTSSGMLKDSFLKELLPPLPVMNIVAIPLSEKKTKGLYTCPVYYTGIRGGTFTFEAQLKTDEPVSKWVLGGVALLMSE